MMNEEKIILSQDKIIRDLILLMKKNNGKNNANDIFEAAISVDMLEKKLEQIVAELTDMKCQLTQIQGHSFLKSVKTEVIDLAGKTEYRCMVMRGQITEVKNDFRKKASDLTERVKQNGKVALFNVTEFMGIKEKLEKIRENVKKSIRDTEIVISKIDCFRSGMRESFQKAANTFRNFMDKEEVEYAIKENGFSKPWQIKKRMFCSMEYQLDAAISGLSNLSRDVGKEKEVIPNVGEMADCQYGSEVFEAYQRECVGQGELNFSNDELNIVYQYAQDTKEETLAGLEEIIPLITQEQTKEIVKNTIAKLKDLPDKECCQFIKDTKKQCMEERDSSILQQLESTKKQQEKEGIKKKVQQNEVRGKRR